MHRAFLCVFHMNINYCSVLLEFAVCAWCDKVDGHAGGTHALHFTFDSRNTAKLGATFQLHRRRPHVTPRQLNPQFSELAYEPLTLAAQIVGLTYGFVCEQKRTCLCVGSARADCMHIHHILSATCSAHLAITYNFAPKLSQSTKNKWLNISLPKM